MTSFHDELYERMGILKDPDPQNNYAMRDYTEVIAEMFDEINDLIRDDGDKPGWADVFDLDNILAEHLPWLGQFVGVRLVGASLQLPEADQRQLIRDTEGFWRGTPASLAAAAQRHLTGSKSVTINEQTDSPYHFQVTTLTIETPDHDAVEAALLAQKPAGLIMEYLDVDGQTYATLAADHANYTAVAADYATYQEMEEDS